MKIQLQDEWNPSGYYTITVIATLQFDPVLLAHLQDLSIMSYISSDTTLITNREEKTEYVTLKPWVSACE